MDVIERIHQVRQMLQRNLWRDDPQLRAYLDNLMDKLKRQHWYLRKTLPLPRPLLRTNPRTTYYQDIREHLAVNGINYEGG